LSATNRDPVTGKVRVSGEDRIVLRIIAADLYKDGKPGENGKGLSVRGIIEELKRQRQRTFSYGFVYQLLEEAIQEGLLDRMRDRGGATALKRSGAASA
jgi:hypothetical protein